MEFEETVYLPSIKIVGIKEVLQSRDAADKDKDVGIDPITQDKHGRSYRRSTGQNIYDVPDFAFYAGRRRADERFVRDKIGEELAPDSTVWELYQEEATDFDNEMVDGRNKNLDMMLLFAGLFSAVVTGFLIESKSMLEQDPAEASLALLLHIAQSQQRLEEGSPRAASPLIEIPTFEAPVYARWVNGLWFLSLGLSLCAALVAMLAKEWLTAFVSSRPRSPRAHALLHQQRLKAWRQWYAFHIIDFLPTVLHFALLLFSAGLTVYLWALDYAIAIATVCLVGSTAIFYAGTAILAAKSKYCPYVTQVSKYIQISFTSISRVEVPVATLSAIIQTLQWLAENARDETTANCSYQALAGMKYSSPLLKDLKVSAGEIHLQLSELSGSQSQYTSIANILSAVCDRVAQVLHPDNRRLSPSEGFSVSRYASALPHLVTYLESNIVESFTETWSKETPSQSALHALDCAWSSNSPYLTADAIMLLTSTEIRLAEIATSRHRPIDPPPDTGITPSHANWSGSDITNIQNWTTISSIEPEIARVPLFELRARFSRALFRAGVQLGLYASGHISTRTDSLIHLLESIGSGLLCSALNPATTLSTHQPQTAGGAPPLTLKSSLAGAGVMKYVRLLDIGDDDQLLVPLMQIVCQTDFTDSPELARVASRTLSIAARVLLPQWINLSVGSSGDTRAAEALQVLEFWSNISNIYPRDALGLGVRNIKQFLALALIDSLCAGCRGAGMIAAHAFEAIYQFASQGTLGQSCSLIVARDEAHAIYQILVELNRAEEKIKRRVLQPLTRWLNVVVYPARETVMHTFSVAHRDALQELLTIWASTPGLHNELDCVVNRILQGHMGNGLSIFESPEHISVLAAIGGNTTYAPTLARLTVHFVVKFLGENPQTQDWERLCSSVSLPHFLQIVGVALNYLSSSGHEHRIISESFTHAASALHQHIRDKATSIYVDLYEETILDMMSQDRSILPMICQVLRDRLVSLPVASILLPEYEEFTQRLDDPEAWLYQPIAGLFELNDFCVADHGAACDLEA